MSGYSRTDRNDRLTSPKSTSIRDITVANTGRRIDRLEIHIDVSDPVSTYGWKVPSLGWLEPRLRHGPSGDHSQLPDPQRGHRYPHEPALYRDRQPGLQVDGRYPRGN